jgi:hypothetical protein
MSNGAAEPFLDSGEVSLVNALVSSGFVSNTLESPSDINDQMSGTIFASSYWSTNYLPSLAFDNVNPATDGALWISSNKSSPQYIGRLGSVSKTVGSARLTASSYINANSLSWQVTSGSIEYSLDSTTGLDGIWTVAVSFSTVWSYGQVQTFDFPSPITAPHWRLKCTASGGAYFGVAELEFLSVPVVNPASVVLAPVSIVGVVLGG